MGCKSGAAELCRFSGRLTLLLAALTAGANLRAAQIPRLGISVARTLSTYFPGAQIASHSSDDPDPIASSEHFELAYPTSQEHWVEQTLEMLERWRKELGVHAE